MDIPMMEELKNNTNEAKEELLAKLAASGAVKRIQRGYSNSVGDISISEINPEKTIILVNGSVASNSNNYTTGALVYVQNVTNNSFTTGCHFSGGIKYDWQVVEFY